MLILSLRGRGIFDEFLIYLNKAVEIVSEEDNGLANGCCYVKLLKKIITWHRLVIKMSLGIYCTGDFLR